MIAPSKQNEIGTIVKWADGGAPEGNPKDAPPAIQWPEGWLIKPDVIIDGPVTDVPATPKNNVVEWITVIVPTGFTQDTWVRSVQIKPEHAAVTHHICTGYAPHLPNVKYGLGVWSNFDRDEEGAARPEKGPLSSEEVKAGATPAMPTRPPFSRRVQVPAAAPRIAIFPETSPPITGLSTPPN